MGVLFYSKNVVKVAMWAKLPVIDLPQKNGDFSEQLSGVFVVAVDDETYIWAVQCLNGEITTDMRLVVLKKDEKKITFQYYLDQEPSEFTRERAEVVAVTFDAGLGLSLDTLDIEFEYTREPVGRLGAVGRTLFRRWENDACGTQPDF
jgi:hypothetical protein